MKQHTMFHRPATNCLGGTWGQKLLSVFRKTAKKYFFFEKSLKISRGIAIVKQHTKFHRAVTNRSSSTRGQKFLSVFWKNSKNQINTKFAKILESIPRYYHNEPAYQISLMYDQQFRRQAEQENISICFLGKQQNSKSQKSLKKSRGITITKPHTKFH